jgi:hypothetical protein
VYDIPGSGQPRLPSGQVFFSAAITVTESAGTFVRLTRSRIALSTTAAGAVSGFDVGTSGIVVSVVGAVVSDIDVLVDSDGSDVWDEPSGSPHAARTRPAIANIINVFSRIEFTSYLRRFSQTPGSRCSATSNRDQEHLEVPQTSWMEEGFDCGRGRANLEALNLVAGTGSVQFGMSQLGKAVAQAKFTKEVVLAHQAHVGARMHSNLLESGEIHVRCYVGFTRLVERVGPEMMSTIGSQGSVGPPWEQAHAGIPVIDDDDRARLQ